MWRRRWRRTKLTGYSKKDETNENFDWFVIATATGRKVFVATNLERARE